ncbi:hypothetical protein EIN_160340 [Entamoeba invadens IP1]|uniref:Uncharacterized protein n=1 Tax=Entamoeba invadens IP1 TaxID=370355 RepID=A0A0A1U4A7_ENTIV|nr:hypothetical protein EIN_160340 [Entamoeba invadens IP1]ELP86530.1 hypothetical protein EIN_160340 [Entamoeba invadens IP1]|eukprot:XP_004185876.1 hypothetical protein EIN_160340 [Entamoeba invadens IP1]
MTNNLLSMEKVVKVYERSGSEEEFNITKEQEEKEKKEINKERSLCVGSKRFDNPKKETIQEVTVCKSNVNSEQCDQLCQNTQQSVMQNTTQSSSQTHQNTSSGLIQSLYNLVGCNTLPSIQNTSISQQSLQPIHNEQLNQSSCQAADLTRITQKSQCGNFKALKETQSVIQPMYCGLKTTNGQQFRLDAKTVEINCTGPQRTASQFPYYTKVKQENIKFPPIIRPTSNVHMELVDNENVILASKVQQQSNAERVENKNKHKKVAQEIYQQLPHYLQVKLQNTVAHLTNKDVQTETVKNENTILNQHIQQQSDMKRVENVNSTVSQMKHVNFPCFEQLKQENIKFAPIVRPTLPLHMEILDNETEPSIGDSIEKKDVLKYQNVQSQPNQKCNSNEILDIALKKAVNGEHLKVRLNYQKEQLTNKYCEMFHNMIKKRTAQPKRS